MNVTESATKLIRLNKIKKVAHHKVYTKTIKTYFLVYLGRLYTHINFTEACIKIRKECSKKRK